MGALTGYLMMNFPLNKQSNKLTGKNTSAQKKSQNLEPLYLNLPLRPPAMTSRWLNNNTSPIGKKTISQKISQPVQAEYLKQNSLPAINPRNKTFEHSNYITRLFAQKQGYI
jgi:predicted HTH transcriptional regulator